MSDQTHITDYEVDDLLEPSVCGSPFAKDCEEVREIELFLREAEQRGAERKRRQSQAA